MEHLKKIKDRYKENYVSEKIGQLSPEKIEER